MHYDCKKNNHGLPHDPYKAIVALVQKVKVGFKT